MTTIPAPAWHLLIALLFAAVIGAGYAELVLAVAAMAINRAARVLTISGATIALIGASFLATAMFIGE